jgi:EAL domain-containing protein (putative c-di-GMP-specific phosphodiesterase class I)
VPPAISQPQTAAPGPDFEGVCLRFRDVLLPLRAQSLSVHDPKGDVLHLCENSLGPDEHGAAIEALNIFSQPQPPRYMVGDLGDGRSALSFRIGRSSQPAVGAVMLVGDERAVRQFVKPRGFADDPPLREVLREFAGLLRADVADAQPPAKVASKPAAPRHNNNVTPEVDRLSAALRSIPIALYAQKLSSLRPGGQLRRYEVLLRSASDIAPNAAPALMLKSAIEHGLGSMIDRRVITELLGWLAKRNAKNPLTGSMFSVNLTATALHDEHFAKFIELCFAKAALPVGLVAFELSTPDCLKLASNAATFSKCLQKLGCPLILDDFTVSGDSFSLLRLPGLRMLKLAPALTESIRTDKVAQATIAAVVQAARVLGLHTVGKRAETPAESEWMTALGVDFVQSLHVSPPAPIDSVE